MLLVSYSHVCAITHVTCFAQVPMDQDLDLLLDERTGVKLLGLDAVVEDPSTDPAFDSYKV